MGGIEIFLIIVGIAGIVCSFLIKDKVETGVSDAISENEIKNTTKEIVKEEVTSQLTDLTEEILDKTEARLDKIANEKIMAVGDYSDDVLKKIENNHSEVMFLYNMLNDKEETLKNAVRDIEALKLSIKKMSEDMVRKPEEKAPARPKRERKPKAAIESEIAEVENIQGISEEGVVISNDIKQDLVEKTLEKTSAGSGRKPKIAEMEELPDTGNKDKILELYKEGKTNIEIAKELGLGVGEVNLVLGLFK